MIALSEKERKDLQIVLSKVLERDEGVLLMRFLLTISGFHKPVAVVQSTGEIAKESMAYTDGGRAVYMALRPLMSKEKLIEVEIEGDERWQTNLQAEAEQLEIPLKPAHKRETGQGLLTARRRSLAASLAAESVQEQEQ